MDQADYGKRLWSALDKGSTGMLALVAVDDAHALPMTAHFDRPGPLHFFAPGNGKLASALDGGSARASFYYTAGDHDLYATIHGTLAASDDRSARAHFWTDEVERWFPGKKDDPAVAFLVFTPGEAEVWLQQDGGAKSRLHLTGAPEDLHQRITL